MNVQAHLVALCAQHNLMNYLVILENCRTHVPCFYSFKEILTCTLGCPFPNIEFYLRNK